MAECTDKYESWINPSEIPPKPPHNDGIIEIGAVTAGGFRGKHTVGGTTFTELNGKCKDKPNRMKFTTKENGVTFTYEGKVVPCGTLKLVVGTRTQAKDAAVGEDDAKRAKPPDEDEVWVGVKTT